MLHSFLSLNSVPQFNYANRYRHEVNKKNGCPLHVFRRENWWDVTLWLLSSYPPMPRPIKRSFFAPGWTCGMMAIQLPVRFSPVRRLPQVLKEKADCFLKEAFLFFAIHSGPRKKARKRRHQVSTGCCPNHPSEDVASFLRFSQAVRGIFFEVRSNLILLQKRFP